MARLTASFVVGLSFISTALTIGNAFLLKKQFYPSVVYLTKSSTSMAVIYFQTAILSYLSFSLIRWIFFGQLRAAEIERAQERVWHAIMETCLAFTVFRDDFSSKFVIQFVVLFFIKAFHWLADDRVDYMERSPVITLLFHARIMGILSLLSAVDSYFISHAFFTTLMRGASAQIVFGFEYAILLTVVAHITIKYVLHIHDLRSPHPWENKAVYMLYAELFTSFTDVILSRRAINAMNNLFPLATETELAQGDNTCIICREEMTVESSAKKLPCNHIFHPNCLRSWFQRQQTCPTCRTDVLRQRRPPVIPGAAMPQAGAAGVVNQPPAGFNFNANIMFGGNAPNRPLMAFGVAPQPGQMFQPQPQVIQHPPFPVFHPNFVNPFVMNPFAVPPPPQMGIMGQMPPQQLHQPPQGPPPPHPPTATPTDASQQPQIPVPPQPQIPVPPQPQIQNSAPSQQPGTSTSVPTQQQAPSTSAPGSSHPSQQPNMPAFHLPGMFPNFQSPFPFPQPPTHRQGIQFAGLSDAEVADMEGRERRNVEARLQVLRNISVLLDSAVLQLQQYMSIAPQLHTEAPSFPRSGENDQPSSPRQDYATGPATNSGATNADSSDSLPSTSHANNSSNGGASDEIRRRRLAKFGQGELLSPTNVEDKRE